MNRTPASIESVAVMSVKAALVFFCLMLATSGAVIFAQNIKLNGPLPDPGDVKDFMISPDGEWVAYSIETLYEVGRDVYAVPVGRQSEPVLLTDGFESKFTVFDYWITSDSQRVVFVMHDDITGELDWFSSSMSNSSDRIQLDSYSVPAGKYDVVDDVSPDGSRLVYRLIDEQGAMEGDYMSELYSWSVGDAESTLLKAVLETGDWMINSSLTPDDQNVVFQVSNFDPVSTVNDFYLIPFEGGTELELGVGLPQGSIDFTFSPNGSYFIHTPFGSDQGQVTDLYSIALAGNSSVKLNNDPDGSDQITHFAISEDSQRVVFLDTESNLYSTSIDGSSQTLLSSIADEFVILPDSETVVFSIVNLFQSIPLSAISISGGEPKQISADGPPLGLDDHQIQISPNGERIVYIQGGKEDETVSLWSSDADGENIIKLSDGLPNGAAHFDISADGKTVIFGAKRSSYHGVEVFAVSIGGGTLRELSTLPVDVSRITEGLRYAAGGHRAIYQANQDDLSVIELYASDIPDVNNAPWFENVSRTIFFLGQPVTIPISVTDLNQLDQITINQESDPAWLTFQENGDRTATLSGTPTELDLGTHTIELSVADGEGGENSYLLQIEVFELRTELFFPFDSGENQAP